MKYKKIFSVIMALAGIVSMTSCEDMMDLRSESMVFDEDHHLSSANDSLYSAMGIMGQLQKLGERYVLFGELRGDLVSVAPTAPVDYQNVSNFDKTTGGEVYGSKRDYYNVINNCNVALQRMDTTIREHSTSVMLPEYAAIHTFRAWTMLQVALAYGSVCYYEEPVLTVEDVEKDVPQVKLDELVGLLISDLEPFAGVNTPNYGTVDGLNSVNFFIRPDLLLGDLYLYNGNYEMAAAMYYNVMYDRAYNLGYGYGNTWTSSVRSAWSINHTNTYLYEMISEIPYASDAKRYHPNLVNLTYNTVPALLPATWYINEMNAMTHFHIDRVGINTITGYLEGDLRGMLIDREGNYAYSSFGYMPTGLTTTPLIMKYFANGTEYSTVSNPSNEMYGASSGAVLTREVALYRIPHLYLRYAEAANRAGKPSLAFATIKYGLRNEVMTDSLLVDQRELADGATWTNFTDSRFDGNYGTAMRGRGLGMPIDNESYIIPELPTRQDSIEWVEDRILEELAAETAFEGNRFFDLLRISRHRPAHPAYFARKVSRRFDNPASIEQRLSDINNLWIK